MLVSAPPFVRACVCVYVQKKCVNGMVEVVEIEKKQRIVAVKKPL